MEDDEDFRLVLRKEVGRLSVGADVETCFLDRVQDARRVVGTTRVDVILSDFELPDGTGADILDHARSEAPEAERIVLTGTPDKARAATGPVGAPHAIWDKGIGLSELRSRLVQLLHRRVAAAV